MAGLGSILYKLPPQNFVVQSPKSDDLPDIRLDRFLNEVFPVHQDPTERHPIALLSNLDSIINSRLDTECSAAVLPRPEGILGPEYVQLDSGSGNHFAITVDEDFLGFGSIGNFSSMRANTCVCANRWMYEVTLKTQGVMQLGWASPSCIFSNEEGAGDSLDSFAYDGKRLKLWNVGPRKYGQMWVVGDVIGCAIDATLGHVEFFRNGVSMGVIRNLRPGIAYFPAMSISVGEQIRVNFGNVPFKHPQADYAPLQQPPASATKTKYLIDVLTRLSVLHTSAGRQLASLPDSLTYLLAKLPESQQALVRFVCAGHTVDRLFPLLCEAYNFRAFFGPLIWSLFEPSGASEQLRWIFDTIAACVSEDNLSHFTAKLLVPYLVEDSLSNLWPLQTTHLAFLLWLLQDRRYIKAWLASPGFIQQYETLFLEKGVSKDDLALIIPDIWWEGGPSDQDKAKYDARIAELEAQSTELDRLRGLLLSTFLNDFTPTATNIRGGPLVSPYELVHPWLSQLGNKNILLLRQIVPPGLSPRSTLENIAVAAASMVVAGDPEAVAERLWDEALYVDDWFGSKLPVVGGDLTHAQSELKKKIAVEGLPARPSRQMPSLDQTLTHSSALLYFLGALDVVKAMRNTMADGAGAQTAYKDALLRLDKCDPSFTAAREMLQQGLALFRSDAEERLRTDVLGRLIHLSATRRVTLHSWLRMLLVWLDRAAAQNYFQFFPRHIIVDILELSDTLSALPPTTPGSKSYFSSSPELAALYTKIMHSLTALPGDPRILNPDLPSEVLSGLISLVSIAGNVRILERDEVLSLQFLRNVMRACDQTMWLHCVECLSRCIVGQGFAFAACRSILADLSSGSFEADCYSPHLVDLFLSICRGDADKADTALVASFMNRVFNAVGWSVTEFDQILEDIRQSSIENAENRMRYRRCLRMFDVIVSLLRLLEMLANKAQFLFDGNAQSEVNISRLSQISLLLLYRTTGDSIFDTVIGSHAVSLQSINRMCVLCPLIGVLRGLYTLTGPRHEFVQNSFFNDPSFTDALLQHLTDYHKELETKGTVPEEDLGVFHDLLLRLQRDFTRFKASQATLDASKTADDDEDDEDMCTICFASKNTATFQPCGHRSCRLCITRHLLNSTKCFFCNAVVDNVVYSAPGAANDADGAALDASGDAGASDHMQVSASADNAGPIAAMDVLGLEDSSLRDLGSEGESDDYDEDEDVVS